MKKSFRRRPGQCLSTADFGQLFGISTKTFPAIVHQQIMQYDFRYRPVQGIEKEQIILDILKRVESGQFSLAGREGKARWEKGWAENFKNFKKQGSDLASLVPKYIRAHQPVRLNQEYVMPVNPRFELNWYEIFRSWVFQAYLKNVDQIYEFGCGSGFNLAVLARLFPDKKLFGMDWAAASKEIVDDMGKAYGWKMQGRFFDFFAPDKRLRIAKNSAVLTIGALEQTGREWGAFLEYLLRSKPAICVHIEPIVEWYDDRSLVDYTAIRFHQKRKYWEGFPARLQKLADRGKVKIIKAKRSFFGSLYLEGYSQLIWRPI